MNKDYLYKWDALFVLYEKEEKEDYGTIHLTSKTFGTCFHWIEFEPELNELEIKWDGDECFCSRDVDRLELKKELEARGFDVKLGEYYQ